MKTDTLEKVNTSREKCPPLALAPMAGFSDCTFRLMCYECGADMAVTEMISAKAMTYRDKKTSELAKIKKGEKSTAIQLFGHEPSVMAEAAEMIEKGDFEGCAYGEMPSAIDINMGCPVKKIALSGDGSALMKDPLLASRIVSAVKERVNIPVTVKIRAGWDRASKNAPEIARACAAAGADMICVHGRTREEFYNPGVDLDIVKRTRECVDPRIPVFANGDICNGESAYRMYKETGCDGLMIGREALGNPWIFDEIKAYFELREYHAPSKNKRIDAAIALVEQIVADKGEERGIREARGRSAHFIRGMRGSAEVRAALNSAKSLAEFERILAEWK